MAAVTCPNGGAAFSDSHKMAARRDTTLTENVLARRDVKLENIFIAEDGRVRLGDFGLTMSMKQELAISPVGTVEYMAPEVPHCRFLECTYVCQVMLGAQLQG